MSRKTRKFDKDIITIDPTQEYRSDLFHMQLYYNKSLQSLNNSNNSFRTIRQIRSNIQDVIEYMLDHYQHAKKENKLPPEYSVLN